MAITPGDIIEAIVDELVQGEFASNVAEVKVARTAPGALLVNYGSEGRFAITVAPEV